MRRSCRSSGAPSPRKARSSAIRSRKAPARLTNGLKFSYPGYSEMFCGFADPGINSNAKKSNPNLSVLEFLNNKPAYKDRVAAFCTWDVFPFIFRTERNGLKVHIDWQPVKDPPAHRAAACHERDAAQSAALLAGYCL